MDGQRKDARVMLILSAEDIAHCFRFPASDKHSLDAASVVAAIESALQDSSAQCPTRLSTTTDKHVHLWMPACAQSVTAIKCVAAPTPRGPPGLPATTLVFDGESGAVSACINASELTAIRTAAASALSALKYAKAEAQSLLIFGSGRQAVWHAVLLAHLFPTLAEIRVWSRNSDHAHRLVEEVSAALGSARQISTVASLPEAEQLAKSVDMIAFCTPSAEPLINLPTTTKLHIMAIGSYKPRMREFGLEPLFKSGTVAIFVDSKSAALAEAGELQFLRGHHEDQVHEIASTSAAPASHSQRGKTTSAVTAAMRQKDTVTVFKSVGTASMDVSIARITLERARARGLGTQVPF